MKVEGKTVLITRKPAPSHKPMTRDARARLWALSLKLTGLDDRNFRP